MNGSQVYELLKNHFEETGAVMEPVPLILQSEGAAPEEVMRGRAHFQTYLRNIGAES